MKTVAIILGSLLVTGGALAAKPVRPASLSTINVAPRAVPVPLAGAGLPALIVLGVLGWRRMRRPDTPTARRDD